MLFIVVAGVGIIMYISIREKSHDMGILRARGIDRGVVFKIQLAEGTTLIILGLIFSLIGILGAKAILLEFDLLFGYFTQLKRDLLVPWGKIAIQLLISLALFVGIIGLAVKIESKNSNIGPISELLRIS
jgi:ABC-type lipoprotein release transport system permease subunit